VNDVINSLIALSRAPRPSMWSATLDPLARRAEVATVRHLGQRVEHAQLADSLALVSTSKAEKRITPDALPLAGKLVALGRDLRAALDSSFIDLRDAVRAATGATAEPEFVSAVEQIQRRLPGAESTVERVDTLVAEIGRLVARLGGMEFVSDALVIPKRDASFA
jgi:hypothetical protein